ncbi:MAG: hypothetical protein HWE10_13650 [Gammaproteobacteria bacterium]|nr:hypothetical protein [Gammaproteobacteria bacterium]
MQNTQLQISRRGSFTYQFGLLLMTIALLFAGVYLTHIEFMQKEWLSRTGSLVVVLGILSGFSGIIFERMLQSRFNIKMRLAIAKQKKKLRKLNAEQAYIDKELAAIEESFELEGLALTQKLKYSIGLSEGLLLILGTLVWGFGDLINF